MPSCSNWLHQAILSGKSPLDSDFQTRIAAFHFKRNEPLYYDICLWIFCGPATSFHAPLLSYPPIVASGAHASTLHYTLENGIVAGGDLLVRCLRALLN